MTDNFDTLTARVLVNLGLDRIFEYTIPPELKGRVKVGVKVRVPFGAGKAPREAYVVAVAPPSGRGTLKAIDSLCEESPSVPGTLLKLGEWIADYYCCTKEHAMRCLLPSAVRNGKIKSKKETIYYIADPEKAAQFTANAKKNAAKRVSAIKSLTLRGGKDMAKLISEGSSRASVNALVKEGLLKKDERTVDRDPMKNVKVVPSKPCTPTPEQAEALKKIFAMCDDEKRTKHVLLLHGITCSGKTEVYLQAIARVLEKGGDAIVLVPEIALTPQTVTRFKGRFGDMVSVLHSGLTDGERYDEWMKVHTGRVKIAVGARSALFAPFKNLKLIIVDEEHEPSYKQSETPRYNARDVAVMRGKRENAAVILGSATPSFESYANALNGKYELAEMFKRTDPSIVLPDVKIIDMRLEKDDDGRRPYFSKMLVEGVRERIRNNEQSIIFLNKRGYARRLICPDCGFVAQCPECSVPYTYHRKTKTLSCHLCASVIPAPENCPQCGSKEIQYRGAGTERIENVSFDVFKGARIARMDSDTMTNPEAYEKVLDSFHRGETDVLIGTQMIAKGLDFPNVTLVGIVNADLGLYIPDFRAQERSFQLLAQVAGRAGRGFVKGEVIIQTECPENAAIQCASRHDFRAFYEEEAPFRKEMGLPPCSHIIQLHFDGADPVKVLAEAQKITERLSKAVGDTAEIGEAAPAPIERIKGRYRFVSLVRGVNLALARKVIRLEIMQTRARTRKIDFYADVDAVNMM